MRRRRGRVGCAGGGDEAPRRGAARKQEPRRADAEPVRSREPRRADSPARKQRTKTGGCGAGEKQRTKTGGLAGEDAENQDGGRRKQEKRRPRRRRKGKLGKVRVHFQSGCPIKRVNQSINPTTAARPRGGNCQNVLKFLASVRESGHCKPLPIAPPVYSASWRRWRRRKPVRKRVTGARVGVGALGTANHFRRACGERAADTTP